MLTLISFFEKNTLIIVKINSSLIYTFPINSFNVLFMYYCTFMLQYAINLSVA